MKKKELLVIGACVYDITSKILGETVPADSNPSVIYTSCGGVGRNIAENAANLGVGTALITAVGDDGFSEELRASCEKVGIETTGFLAMHGERSAVYLTIMDRTGELVMAASDLKLLESVPVEKFHKKENFIGQFPVVLLDANLTPEAIAVIAEIAGRSGAKLFADAVSIKKSVRLCGILDRLDTLKVNRTELEALTEQPVTSLESAKKAMEALLARGVRRVVVTLGMDGSCMMENKSEAVEFSAIPAFPCTVADATGAGDCYMAAVVYGTLHGFEGKDLLCLGTAASHLALAAKGAVNHELSEQRLLAHYEELKGKAY